MLDFDIINIHSFINRQTQNNLRNTIVLDLRYIKELMNCLKIRKTKENIKKCAEEFNQQLELILNEDWKISKYDLDSKSILAEYKRI